jgi:hypothetical protein
MKKHVLLTPVMTQEAEFGGGVCAFIVTNDSAHMNGLCWQRLY